MTWNLQGRGNLTWPAELDPKSYAAANKTKGLDEILNGLATAQTQWGRLDLPFVPADTARADSVQPWVAKAKAFPKSGDVRKVVTTLQMVANAARTMESTKSVKQGNKTIKLDPAALNALKAIRTASDAYGKSVSPAVFEPEVTRRLAALQAGMRARALQSVATVLPKFKACAAGKHPELVQAKQLVAAWPSDPAAQQKVRQDVGNCIYNASRDMSQNVVNLAKALAAGADPADLGLQPRDVSVFPKLGSSLAGWGDKQPSSYVGGKSPQELSELLRTVGSYAQLYDQIATHLK